MTTIMGLGDTDVNYRIQVSTEELSLPTLSDWLKRQLARRQWNQADLARAMGADRGVVSNWVRGQRVPSPDSCERLADVLGVDRDIVLALAGHRLPDIPLDPNSGEAELIAMIRSIRWSEPYIGIVRDLLESIRENTRKGSTSQ